MQTPPPIFFFSDLVVGQFAPENYPPRDGDIHYQPFRGPGHGQLQAALKTAGGADCYFKREGERIAFRVVGCPSYGVISIAGLSHDKPRSDHLVTPSSPTPPPEAPSSATPGGLRRLGFFLWGLGWGACYVFSIGASRLGVPLAALLASILVIGGPFVFCSMRAKNMSLPWWAGAIFCGVCCVFSLAYELLLSQHFTIAPVFSVVFSLLVTSSATFLLTAPEGFASSKKYDTIGKSIAVLLSVVFVPWSFMSPGIIRENNIVNRAAQDFSGSVFNMPNPRLDKSVLMGFSRSLNGEYVVYSPFNFEYVKYGRDYPYDELRVEALTREKTPAAEFLYQVYLPKIYLPKFSHTGAPKVSLMETEGLTALEFERMVGAPKVSLMETGTVQTIFGSASYLQVRMPEGGSWSKGTSGVKVDAIRTVLAVNSGKVLIIASRQRDEEEGFNGAFDEKILDPAKQLADLVGMVDTIQIRAK